MAPIRYQLTYREAISTAFARRMLAPLRIAISALLLAFGVALIAYVPDGRFYGVLLVVVAAVGPVAVYMALARVISGAPWLTAPTTLEFDDAGVRLSAGDVRTELRWTAFRGWKRGREHFFLLFGRSGAALTIPLRAFDAATLDAFTRQLQHVGRKDA